MKKLIFLTTIITCIAHADNTLTLTESKATTPTVVTTLLNNMDTTVRPQDDFYQYANGTWLKAYQLPNDKSRYGAFNELIEKTQLQELNIITQLQKQPDIKQGSNQQKVRDVYNDFMNQQQLNSLGYAPIKPILKKVNDIKNTQDIAKLLGYFTQIGVSSPYDFGIHQDAKDSTKMIVDIYQSGLGLPDQDYYLKKDDPNMLQTLNLYQTHISKMLILTGIAKKSATTQAKDIVALETALAKIQWTNVQNRDPIKTYNKYSLTQLNTLMPEYSWQTYLNTAKLTNKIDYVIVSQPSYLVALNQLIKTTPIKVWQEYFRWKVIASFAPYLSDTLANEDFKFTGTVLRGTSQDKPRWKKGIDLVNNGLGEAIGQLYVAQYFQAEDKIKMNKMVDNLMQAYAQSIENLEWMDKQDQKQALIKLNAINRKIGYPDKWIDYSTLKIKPNNLIENILNMNQFAYNQAIDELGKPVDRSKWGMTPQTVNAYYNPEMNEIVFPAAILQAPFFDKTAPDAMNYGGIGAVIGHEISHGFDDQGSQYDEHGNLHDWLSVDDHNKFKQKTTRLVNQYAAYSPLESYHVNGELTLGENIADNSGLNIAYKAYQISLNNQPAPVIAGFTGEQLLYLSWANVWREEIRDKQLIMYLKSDVHSPGKIRGFAPLRNQEGFYKAFNIQKNDKMYLAPESRVTIW